MRARVIIYGAHVSGERMGRYRRRSLTSTSSPRNAGLVKIGVEAKPSGLLRCGPSSIFRRWMT